MHNRTILMVFLAVAGFIVATTTSQAGFEYVPHSGAPSDAQDNIDTKDVLSPAPAAVPAPVEDVRALPLPADTQMQTPVSNPSLLPPPVTQPGGFLRAPEHAIKKPVTVTTSVTAEPKMQIKTLAPAKNDPSIRWNPQGAAQAVEAPVASRAEKEMIDVEIETTLPVPASEDKPVTRKALVIPSDNALSQPQKTETKIIVPDDAPQSATNAMPKNLIQAFPIQKGRVESEKDVIMPVTRAANEVVTNMETVEGFGSDMPMAIALQQIAPAGFTFSFGDGVNPGARVSWEGNGQPWNQVIDTMLAPLGLKIDIRDKTVRIHNPEFSAVSPDIQKIIAPTTDPVNLAEKTALDVRRTNLTDPGETQKPQPLSTPSGATEMSSPISSAESAVTIEIIEPAAGQATVDKSDLQSSSSEQTTAVAQEDKNNASPIKDDAEKTLAALDDAINKPSNKILLQPEQALIQAAKVSAQAGIDTNPAIGAKQFFVTPSQWTAQNGQSLKQALGVWSKDAGVSIVWEASHDFIINGSLSIEDTFQGAVQTLMEKGLQGNEKPSITFQIPAERGKPGVLLIQDQVKEIKEQG
jgi:hypothetical protein